MHSIQTSHYSPELIYKLPQSNFFFNFAKSGFEGFEIFLNRSLIEQFVLSNRRISQILTGIESSYLWQSCDVGVRVEHSSPVLPRASVIVPLDM